MKMASQRLVAVLVAGVCAALCVSAAIVPQANSSLSTAKVGTASCCQFESNTCGFSYSSVVPSTTWEWSYYVKPTPSLSSSNYIWTQNENTASSTSAILTVSADTTVFGFSYYAETSATSSYIAVYFLPSGGSLVLLDKLVSSGGEWLHRTADCVGRSCCITGYPCNGYIFFEALIASGSTALFAVDDVEIDNGCSYPDTGCCEFDANTCGFDTSYPAITGLWEWSNNGYKPNPTYFPAFPTTSSYIFSENDNSATTLTTLSSFSASTTFEVRYFVQTDNPSSALVVSFTSSGSGSDVLIDILLDTSGAWASRSFSCGASGCCSSYPCSGQIKFEARVQSPNALFAIDNVDMNGSCL